MALTLTEASKLSTDVLQRGVIETFARTSPVLELLPFMTIEGNSYQYNVEDELPNIEYRAVNEGYTEGGGHVSIHQESLVMLGGDVDVDVFLHKTLGNINNQRAVQTQLKTKAVGRQFTHDFFKGDNKGDSVNNANFNPKAFNGLDKRLEGTRQTVDALGSGLSMSIMHELLDMVAGGANAIFMTKKTRRALQAVLEGQTHIIQDGKDNFGRKVEMFGDVEIRTVENDYGVNDGELYAVRFNEGDGVAGLENGGVMVADLGQIAEKPVYRTRIEFYCGMAVFHPESAARIHGLTV